MDHAGTNISRKGMIAISSYCQNVLSSIEIFKKEIKITAKLLKLERDTKITKFMKEIVEEEKEFMKTTQLRGTSSNQMKDAAQNLENMEKTLQLAESRIIEEDLQTKNEVEILDVEKQLFENQCATVSQYESSSDSPLTNIFDAAPLEQSSLSASVNEDSYFKNLHFVIEELYRTEISYIDDLHQYRDLFESGLKELITPSLHQTIFQYLGSIIQCNNILWENYLGSSKESTVLYDKCQLVANAFISREEEFKSSYAPYIGSYSSIIEAINNIKSNKMAEAYLNEVRLKLAADNAKMRNIGAFAITPVQRIPRYKLLLIDLQNKLPPSWCDLKKEFILAVDAVGRAADYCNDQARAVTLQKRAQELEKKLLLRNVTLRKFYDEYSQVRWIKQKRKIKIGTLYIFEDCLLFVPEGAAQRYRILYFQRDIIDIQDTNGMKSVVIFTETHTFDVEPSSFSDTTKLLRISKEAMKHRHNKEPIPEIQPKGKIFHWLIKQNSKLSLR